ncbi:MAG: serine/threonine-protein kinase [Blastococcus sp.]
MTRPLTAPGRLVAGRYRLQSQIGGGGMGTVWLAQDERLGRQVAIKQVLLPAGASSEEADQQRQRALREGRIAARLSHPHAISVYDVALESGQPWLVMEYLPSRSLAEVLSADGVLRGDLVAQIGAQVADAMAATHAAGIVHRDIKPANVLIGEGAPVEGLVKITDFGISHASGDVTLTQTGQITGTPAYLAPEVAQGHEMTEASDVFSLGATLYTCLEGQPPFGMQDNALGMLHRVAGGQIMPPRRAGGMTQPLLKMLAADPADRPTMPQVRDELATLAAGSDGNTTTVLLARTNLRSSGAGRAGTDVFPEPVVAAPQPPTPPPPTPPRSSPPPSPPPVAPSTEGRRRRRPGIWIAAGVAILLLAGLIAVLVNQGSGGSGSSAGGSTAASSPGTRRSGGAPTSAAGSAPSSAPSSSPAPAPGAAMTAKDIKSFLLSYHQLVLSDPHQAYAETGPTLRAAESEQNYANYWGQFSEVKLSGIQAQDGQNTATAKVEFRYSDGRKLTEQHKYTLILDGGHLILDSDYKIG